VAQSKPPPGKRSSNRVFSATSLKRESAGVLPMVADFEVLPPQETVFSVQLQLSPEQESFAWQARISQTHSL
jgi:hypothetical protein